MSVFIPAIITIDGPSGSGKGTISQLVAQKLGFQLLDSGALYRLVALAAANHAMDFDNEEALATLAAHLDAHFDSRGDSTVIMLEGEDVTDAIRTESVSMNASRVAAIESVREALLQRQREFAGEPGLVADGRDMGTTVFPAADVKIFLTASAEERAQRRYKQLINKGESVSLPALLDDIQARDRRDMERSASPLKPASDAHVLDSSKMSIQQVLEAVLAKAADKGIEPPVAV